MKQLWIKNSRCVLGLFGEKSRVLVGRGLAGSKYPDDSGALTNLVEIGKARDKVCSLKLDQVSSNLCHRRTSHVGVGRNNLDIWLSHINTRQSSSHITASLDSQVIKIEAALSQTRT